MFRSSLTLAVVLLASLGGCDRDKPEPVQETPAGAPAAIAKAGEIDRSHARELMPAANLVDPAGRTLNLGALQGRPVLLNLWATWCAPCVKEMPLLDDLAGDLGEDLRVVVASQDLNGAEAVAPFFAKAGFAHLEPWMDTDNALSAALASTLPTTVLYDAAGQEVWRVAGDLDWADPAVRGALDEAVARAK